ncbi:hypothetical protein [Nocardioides nitrophenolicus]|uniref:hypothetical protein n=1 Tax=Nocardioides nitrophenolicus TaxID=60489 RepID=UPI0019578240|nr:hypothetical protein [Nocardioides nitrophenolicus]MBM7515714.1 hypothetical protein [Nocardioides nitrophenolicus]
MAPRLLVLFATVLAFGSACATATDPAPDDASAPDRRDEATSVAPTRFTIVPDDYHVPYAGTAEDGRRFFLSDELFAVDAKSPDGTAFVGLFLWDADGGFAEIRVDPVPRAEGVPPGQALSAGADELIEQRLAELGDYRLEPITVEPFLQTVDGVTFGWAVTEFEGEYSINIEPGDFIAYYEPWDGVDYDT